MKLLEGTLHDAIEALAKRAADLRTRPRTYAEKQAAGMSDFLGSIGSAFKDNPALSGALLGGGLGAATGGIRTAMGNADRDPSEHRSVLGGALTGGLAGTAIGGGAGLAYRGLKGLGNPTSGPTGTDALQAGEFVGPDGVKMRIDPQALRDDPNLASKIRQLRTPTMPTAVGGSVLAGLDQLHQAAPWTSTLAALGGLGDLAMHNPIYGFAHRSAENIGGRVGRNLLSRGAEATKDMKSALRDAIMGNTATGGTQPIEHPPTTATGKPTYTKGKFITAGGHTDGKSGVLDILGGGRATRGKGLGTALEIEHTPTREVETEVPGSGAGEKQKFKTQEIGAIERPSMNYGELGQLKAKGLHGSEWEGRRLYQVPVTKFSYGGAKSWPMAIAGRAAMYGLPMGGEWLLRGGLEDLNKQRQYQQLISHVAKPVA